MKRCTKCRNLEIFDSANFCGRCGGALAKAAEVRCLNCGELLGIEGTHKKFCSHCGTEVGVYRSKNTAQIIKENIDGASQPWYQPFLDFLGIK